MSRSDEDDLWDEINEMKADIAVLKGKRIAMEEQARELKQIHAEAKENADRLGEVVNSIMGVLSPQEDLPRANDTGILDK